MTRPTDAEVREMIERLRAAEEDPDIIHRDEDMHHLPREAADMLEALTAQEKQNDRRNSNK